MSKTNLASLILEEYSQGKGILKIYIPSSKKQILKMQHSLMAIGRQLCNIISAAGFEDSSAIVTRYY